MKQGCGGCNPSEMWPIMLCFVKHKNDMHASAALQKLQAVWLFETSNQDLAI